MTGFEIDFFLVAHESDELFASQLHDKVLRNSSIFYDKKSIPWGEIKHPTSTKAFRRAKRIIIIVSKALLNAASSSRTDVLIGAALECEKKILTVYLDVPVEMVKEKQCFLTSYKSLMASRDAVDLLVASIIDLKHEPLIPKVKNGLGASLIRKLPRTLPSFPNGFGGRQRILRELITCLKDSVYRIISITGAPGVGKGALAIALGHSLQQGESARRESDWTTGKKNWTIIYADVAKCVTQNQCAAVILEAMHVTLNRGQEYEQLRKYAEKIAADTAETPLLLLLDHCDNVICCKREEFQSLLRAVVPAFRVVTTSCTQFNDLHLAVKSVDLEPLNASSTCEILMSLCPVNRRLTEELAKEFANLCSGMPIAIRIVAATLALRSRTLIEWLELLFKHSADSHVLETMAGKVSLADDALRNVTACIQTVFDSLTVEEQNQTMCLTLFSSQFSKEEAAIVLGMDESALLDLMAQLEQRSLLQIGKGWFSLHSLIHSFLKAKYKHEKPSDYGAAQVRFAKHFGAQFCKASAIYVKEPKRALSLFQSAEANFEQFRKFVFDDELAGVCIEFAISSELLLKVVMSSSARAEFFELCALSAELKGLGTTSVRLKIREINAMLDDHNCNLEKVQSLMKEVAEKSKAGDDRLLCVERLIAEAQLCLCSNDSHRSLSLITSVCEKYEDVLTTSPLVAASAYSTFGNVAEDLNEPYVALSYYAKGIDMYASYMDVKVQPEHPFVCTIQLQMARCYFHVKDFIRSSELFSRVLKVQTAFGCDRLSLAVTSYHLGIAKACASATGKERTVYDSNALSCLQTAGDEVERLTNDHPLLALSPLALGKIHFWYGVCDSVGKRAMENFDIARRYFNKAVQCCDQISAFGRDLWKLEGLAYLSIALRRLPKSQTDDFQSTIAECRRYHAELFALQKVSIPPIVQLVISQDFEKTRCLDRRLRDCKWGFAGCLGVLAHQPAQPVDDYHSLDSLKVMSQRVLKRSQDFDLYLRPRSSSESTTRDQVKVRRSLTTSLLTSLMYLLPARKTKTVEKDI